MEVSFLQLNPRSADQPYEARSRLGNGRSAIPGDFAKCDVALFNDWLCSLGYLERCASLLTP